MRYSGVLFDLFGTLVAPFRMLEHIEAIRACSSRLGIDFEVCHRQWGETYSERIRGEFGGVADNFAWIARQAGQVVTPGTLADAEGCYHRFTALGLDPVSGALELLDWLASRGARVGLVTNCAPDIPTLWPRLPFAPYFHYCAFSCDLGAVKPEPEIYRAALSALDLRPQETLYVGDGSDRELSGAAACGLQPVLVSVDLSNTYDALRADVEDWSGPTIRALSELRAFLE